MNSNHLFKNETSPVRNRHVNNVSISNTYIIIEICIRCAQFLEFKKRAIYRHNITLLWRRIAYIFICKPCVLQQKRLIQLIIFTSITPSLFPSVTTFILLPSSSSSKYKKHPFSLSTVLISTGLSLLNWFDAYVNYLKDICHYKLFLQKISPIKKLFNSELVSINWFPVVNFWRKDMKLSRKILRFNSQLKFKGSFDGCKSYEKRNVGRLNTQL